MSGTVGRVFPFLLFLSSFFSFFSFFFIHAEKSVVSGILCAMMMRMRSILHLVARPPSLLGLNRSAIEFQVSTFSSDAAGGSDGTKAGTEETAPPNDALASLQAELASTKLKLKDALDSRAYLVAEMENVRRIAKLDVEKAKQYAAQPIAKGLLLAVDNLSITTAAIPKDGSLPPAVASLAEGVGATLKIFLKVLGEHGVAQFGVVGEKFNPNVHEAVAMLPAQSGQDPNTVVNVLGVGYMFKDRVLRPARVTVALKAAAVDEAAAATAATAGSSRSI